MVGGEKPWRAEAVAHLAHVGGTGENVVARIEHVGAKMMTGAQFGVSFGHDLHEAERAFVGDGANIAGALGAHDRANPERRDIEAA